MAHNWQKIGITIYWCTMCGSLGEDQEKHCKCIRKHMANVKPTEIPSLKLAEKCEYE